MQSPADTLDSRTLRFSVGDLPGTLTISRFPADHPQAGQPCRLAVWIARAGDPLRAILSAWAEAVTIGLEAGIPLSRYLEAVERSRFEPAGRWTVDGEVAGGRASSVLDAVAAILRERVPIAG